MTKASYQYCCVTPNDLDELNHIIDNSRDHYICDIQKTC